jgi:hypothetical protein
MSNHIPVLENSPLDALQVCARVVARGFVSEMNQERCVLGLGRARHEMGGERRSKWRGTGIQERTPNPQRQYRAAP